MEETSVTPVQCSSCYTTALSTETFCNSCGYPLQGTDEEKQDFLTRRQVQQIDLEAHQNQVAQASKALYWIAGLMFIGELLAYAMNRDPAVSSTAVFIAAFIEAAIFVGLGFWSRNKPTAALITGLCVFALIQLVAAIDNPLNIVRGIIVKVVIVTYLIKGIKSSLEADKLIKEHNLPVY